MQPSITEAEFEVLVKRSGLTLDAAQRTTLHEVYGYFESMLERVRSPRERGAEPAHIFVPGQG